VSQGLKAVAGVIDAEVSFDEQRADVEYRPDIVAPEALIAAVKEAGFDATLLDESDGS